ncbi:MAG: hypothetical protein LW823_06320 [Rickettsiales bacterium]|jgi:hypothetical protein|nr:hypothetical protein [Rickettsiales bacterium]
MNTPNQQTTNKLMWWITLIVAVMAVPGFGVVVAFMSPTSGFMQLVVFILACWLCTYLGMKLMSDPRMDKKIGGNKD